MPNGCAFMAVIIPRPTAYALTPPCCRAHNLATRRTSCVYPSLRTLSDCPKPHCQTVKTKNVMRRLSASLKEPKPQLLRGFVACINRVPRLTACACGSWSLGPAHAQRKMQFLVGLGPSPSPTKRIRCRSLGPAKNTCHPCSPLLCQTSAQTKHVRYAMDGFSIIASKASPGSLLRHARWNCFLIGFQRQGQARGSPPKKNSARRGRDPPTASRRELQDLLLVQSGRMAAVAMLSAPGRRGTFEQLARFLLKGIEDLHSGALPDRSAPCAPRPV